MTAIRLAFACLLSAPAWAVPLVVQPPDQGGLFVNTTAANPVYDNFTLSTRTIIRSITWWGAPSSGQDNGFFIAIYDDNGGVPDSALHFSTGPSNGTANQTPIGAGVFSYFHVFGNTLVLAPGTYWVAIRGRTQDPWTWKTSDAGDGQFYTAGALRSGDLAFILDSEVPELDPGRGSAALAFAFCALALVGGRRRSVLPGT